MRHKRFAIADEERNCTIRSAKQGLSGDGEDDRRDWDDPDLWQDEADEDSFDPEPLDDSALDGFEFDEVPDELECPPEELWDDADEG